MADPAQETNRLLNTQQPKHTTHTQPTKPKITYNTVTMVPPSRWLPTAPMLQVSAIVVRLTIDHNHRNTAMYFLLRITLTFPLFI
jgi:hypothetical protein